MAGAKTVDVTHLRHVGSDAGGRADGEAGSTVGGRQAALAGVAAAVGALGAGELVAALIDLHSSPVVAVGGLVIDRVPPGGKDLAIRLFGTNDKLALQIGSVLFVCLAAAGFGVLARRWRWVGFAGFGLLGLLAVFAALTRAGSNVGWALPGLVAAGAGAALLARLLAIIPEGRRARAGRRARPAPTVPAKSRSD